MQKNNRLLWLLASVFMLVSGCVSLPEVGDRNATAADLIMYKKQALKADENAWQAMYDTLTQEKNNPSMSAEVKAAILLSVPDRSLEEHEEAVLRLRSVLSQSATQPQSYQDFVTVSLMQIEHEISQHKQRVAYQQHLQRTRRECTAGEQKKQKLEAEIQGLQKALVEAHVKIHSLTKIEQSIERPKGREIP